MAEQAQSTPTAAGPAAQSHTALRTNLTYLIKGPANAAAHPASLRTRSILRTTRYVLKFVFWRLVRYFKYALVGAGVAALAGTFGATMLPWVAAVAVPSVPMAAALGLGTAVVKFGWRHRGDHFRQAWLVGGEGRDARADERADAGEETEDEAKRRRRRERAERAWKTEAGSFTS